MAQIIRLADKARIKRTINVRYGNAELLPFVPKKRAEQILGALLILATNLLLIVSAILVVQRLVEQ